MLIVGEENITESLEELLVRGYCFHGSSVLVDDVLVPHKTNDEIKESGNRKAVYMTKNPLMAEFMALCGGRDVGKRESSCYLEIEGDKVSYPKEPRFVVEKIEAIAEVGYVYVMDARNPEFETVNGEILSYKSVEPMFVIKMKKDEFKYPIETIT